MAAADNYWDEQRQEWVDAATGNHMKPVDRGGTGIWMTADNTKQFINGTWANAQSAGKAAGQTGAGTNSTGAYSPQAGGDYNLQDSVNATNVKVTELQTQNAKEVAELNKAAQSALQDKINNLQLQLKNADITEAQYELAKNQAQQESEFARNLALNNLKEQHSYELNQAGLEIQRAAEQRQERALQASLGANPQDWVAYQLYQRGLPGATAAAGTGGGGSNVQTQLNGQAYDQAPPAASDASLQSMAASLWDPAKSAYNPNLHGTGVFGTTIESPNQLSRGEFGRLSDTEMGLLTGLLKAGITQPNGKRLALNPTDFFAQAGKSWVPTYGSLSGAPTQYN